MFTSGIVSLCEGRRIALFFTGRQHAGENLKDVLDQRAETLGMPIQMCDALSRNMSAELETIVANCLAHGRRQFADVAEHFPEKCRHVLEALSVIYKNDAVARKQNLSPEARLQFHQTESGSVMEELRIWLTRQFDQKRVEPNSGLGQAIAEHHNERRAHSSRGFRPPACPAPAPENNTVVLDDIVCRAELGELIKTYQRRAA